MDSPERVPRIAPSPQEVVGILAGIQGFSNVNEDEISQEDQEEIKYGLERIKLALKERGSINAMDAFINEHDRGHDLVSEMIKGIPDKIKDIDLTFLKK